MSNTHIGARVSVVSGHVSRLDDRRNRRCSRLRRGVFHSLRVRPSEAFSIRVRSDENSEPTRVLRVLHAQAP